MRYDVAIIGTGPAGLEARLTLKNRDKSILLIGSKKSSNKVYQAHEIKNYLGLPNIKGEDFANAFLNHIDAMGIKITDDIISQIYDMGDYYALQGKGSEMYEASSIIVATGVKASKTYEGEDNYLGRGVSYCATCDAPLYKNKDITVILESKDELEEVEFLASVGKNLNLVPLFDDELHLAENVRIIKEKPLRIEGDKKANLLVTDKGSYSFDGLFILRKSVPASHLLMGLEMDDVHIKVNRLMETNLRGVFAAGDIVGKPYQYIKSAGEGNIAALSAVTYLANLKKEGKNNE